MFPVRRSLPLAAVGVLLVLASCSGGTEPAAGGQASLVVTANVSGTAVAMIRVEVTGPGMEPLTFQFEVVSGVASGTLTIPAGSDRTITIDAFDAGSVRTHHGSVMVDVAPGLNSGISLILSPLTGDVPIEATLGSITVTVDPPTNPLSLSGTPQTAQLSVMLRDENGSPVSGSVSWASGNPAVASVSATGLVTAQGVGETNVFATFRGAVGAAAVTVTP